MARHDRSSDPDGALVEAARRGDDLAFEGLLGRHESRVLRLLRLLGVPACDREDVAQEIFLRVFRHLEGFRAGQPFTRWLYRITVNATHDYRKRRRRLSHEAATPAGALDDSPDQGPGPAEWAERRDSRRRLETALLRLSERERSVFVLCELEELPTREVARSLSISSITVRRHLGRARRRLEAVLSEEEEKSRAALNDRAKGEVVTS